MGRTVLQLSKANAQRGEAVCPMIKEVVVRAASRIPQNPGLMEEKSQVFNQVTTDNVSSKETYCHHMSPTVIHEEKHITSVICLPEIHNLNLFTKTFQTSPNSNVSAKYLALTLQKCQHHGKQSRLGKI